jgi:carbonic anhydrase
MQTIRDGALEFSREVFPGYEDLFETLARGQHPRALFITCSDSRVDPNLITQSPPGELFIVRNPGNIVPPYHAGPSSEAAAIEYALDVLGLNHIIVCGHSCCGAMQTLVYSSSASCPPAIASWLLHAKAAREGGEPGLDAAIERNVLVQLENLTTHPAVASAIADGRLELHGWLYLLEHGQIREYVPNFRRFVPLDELPAM